MGKRINNNQLKRLIAREQNAGDRLPYAQHADPSTLLTRDNAVLQTIHVDGLAFETAGTDELNHRQIVRDTMLRSINNHQFTLYHHIVRRRVDVSAEGKFPDPITAGIDRQWQGALSSRQLFVNELFLTILYRPTAGKRGLVKTLFT